MQLLIVSYTPGSSLLQCLEAESAPTAGETIIGPHLCARVLYAELLDDVQGYDCAVVVDDLSINDWQSRPHEAVKQTA